MTILMGSYSRSLFDCRDFHEAVYLFSTSFASLQTTKRTKLSRRCRQVGNGTVPCYVVPVLPMQVSFRPKHEISFPTEARRHQYSHHHHPRPGWPCGTTLRTVPPYESKCSTGLPSGTLLPNRCNCRCCCRRRHPKKAKAKQAMTTKNMNLNLLLWWLVVVTKTMWTKIATRPPREDTIRLGRSDRQIGPHGGGDRRRCYHRYC